MLSPYKQEVARSSRAPPILTGQPSETSPRPLLLAQRDTPRFELGAALDERRSAAA